MKILIVDDDELQARQLKRKLQRALGGDADVSAVTTYAEAECLITTSSPPIDIGVFDLVMQKSHTLSQIKQDPESFEGLRLAKLAMGKSAVVIVTASQEHEELRGPTSSFDADLLSKNDPNYVNMLIDIIIKKTGL